MSVIATNLFMAACMWLFLPIVYVSMRNNTVCKNNLILSVTLPPEGQGDKEVLDYCETHKKKLLRDCVILTVTLLPAVFIPWVSVSSMWSMTWLPVAMFVIMRNYGKGYEGLREIKRRRGWVIPTAGQSVAELRPVNLPKPLKCGWFVPPMIFSALPMISCFVDFWDTGWNILLVMTAGTNLMLATMGLLFHGLIYRQKKDILDDDLELTEALTRVRRRNWTKTWMLLSWAAALYSLAVWCCQGNYTMYMVWTGAFCVVVTVVAVATEFATRRAQQHLTQGRDRMPIVDEDDYWIWGQFYYNPNSNKVMMNERVGMGMNMNYAHPLGKLMAVVCILVLLSLPILGGWMMAMELTDAKAEIRDNTLIVSQLGSRYEIDLDEVRTVEVLETLPGAVRTWGTGMPNLLKGSFSVEGYGNCTLCLDPTDPPFLLIKTEEKTYILGADNLAELMEQLP